MGFCDAVGGGSGAVEGAGGRKGGESVTFGGAVAVAVVDYGGVDEGCEEGEAGGVLVIFYFLFFVLGVI